MSKPGPITWITRSTKSGYSAAHSIAWIDPPEAPATARSFFTPSESTSALCTRTESRSETTGNVIAYGLPVSGSTLAGPVVATFGSLVFRLASASALTTKYLSVSIGLPAPMIGSQ